MLRLLHIENIAVIEQADILFERGFNVMTGETGAGKSIVIDAISAILGERAYRDMIRTGASRAAVRAIFDEVPELAWFAENSVPYDTEVVVQREIYLDGKNLCRVNGVAVTVGILRKLGLQLINIHGQHDSAALFDENYHLTFLDSFAADAPLLEQYRAQFSVMQSLQHEMAHLRMDESEKLRRTETLRYQIDEIERAALKPDEDTQLEARRRLLQNAEKLSDGLRDAAACLDGGDEAQGAAALLTQAERDLAHSARFDESLQPLHDTIADLMYQAQDAAEQLRDRRYRLSYSADVLEQLEERLDLLREADAIAREELSKAGLDRDIWQCPVVLLADVHSVGVQGDERTYGSPIVLRPVSSEVAMTADWSRVPYDVLATISTRITNECRQINRVVLDCTSKPPATIEWE